MNREKNPYDDTKLLWALLCLLVITLSSIPVLAGIGKYQLCKLYFPEMNRATCFFTQLPSVYPRSKL